MELKQIPTDKILANFYQPRIKFDREKIKELAESILSNGLINPITIKEDKKRKGKFMIVSGERRWQAHKVAKLKTISAFVKDYKNEGQFMVESLIENIHREDLSDSETWKFIKRIGKEMGWGSGKNINIDSAGRILKMPDWKLRELRDSFEKTVPEIRRAISRGKLTSGIASEISRAEPEIQKQIGKEALKSEDGLRRAEVREIIREEKPEPIQLEETANNIADDILSDLHNFEYNTKKLLKNINIKDLSKSKMDKLMTTCGLHLKSFKELVNTLRQRGAKPHPLIVALIKANAKF